MNPDGIAYLDVADAYLAGDAWTALNTYWSPLYSWLLAGVMAVADPGPASEAPLVHAVNVVLLLLALVCFEYFLRGLEPLRRAGSAEPGRVPVSWWAFAYALFAWAAVHVVRVSIVTPDLLVLAITLLASGMVLRIGRGSDGYLRLAALGAVLGLGFLAKAALGFAALFFLAAVALVVRPVRRGLGRATVAGLVALAIVGPFVTGLSWKEGRVTFGEAGKLNHAWYVNGVPRSVHWQGEGNPGVPEHPTTVVADEPTMYAFAEPYRVTYAPWYAPAHFFEGLETEVRPVRQARTFLAHLQAYLDLMPWILPGPALLLLLGGKGWLRDTWRRGRPFLVPALGMLGVYTLVHVEGRLVAPFLLLAAVASVAAADRYLGPAAARALPLALAVAPAALAVTTVLSQLDASPPDHARIARELGRGGVPEAASVGIVGSGLNAYWVRLAGARIVAEVPDLHAFWSAGRTGRARILERFRAVGAEVVVAGAPSGTVAADGWCTVEEMDLVWRFSARPCADDRPGAGGT